MNCRRYVRMTQYLHVQHTQTSTHHTPVNKNESALSLIVLQYARHGVRTYVRLLYSTVTVLYTSNALHYSTHCLSRVPFPNTIRAVGYTETLLLPGALLRHRATLRSTFPLCSPHFLPFLRDTHTLYYACDKCHTFGTLSFVWHDVVL